MTTIDRRYSVAEGTAVKAPCRAATTANIALTGLQTIDGVVLAENDRVLVKSQTDGTTNGIYTASSGNWQRSRDFDGAYDIVDGTRIYITSGSASGGTEYTVTTADPITIGATSIAFSSIAATAVAAAASAAASQTAAASSASSASSSATSSASSATSSAASATAAAASAASSKPVPAAFKNLSIKVASNTTVTVAADFVVTTDGTNYQTAAVSSTINLGTTGADALDTGSIAIDTWYAIWVVAKSDGTTKCVASTSSSSPTMPSGYTFKARIGWVKTIHASATLYGTWQLGREARYVVGLAQTSTLPSMASGTSIGNPTTGPTWVSVTVNGGNTQQSFVPSTAAQVQVVLSMASNFQTNSAFAGVAPNNSYGTIGSTTNAPPILYASGTDGSSNSRVGCALNSKLLLESSAIYWAVISSATSNLFCYGWEDNI